MGYVVGHDVIDHNTIPTPVLEVEKSYYGWRVQIIHKSGGVKGDWILGARGCPLEGGGSKFTLSQAGSAKCSLAFAKFDFPIHSGDVVFIYRNGVRKFRGYVEYVPDRKGNKTIEAISFIKRLENLFYNGSFSSKTIAEVYETVISAVQIDSGIYWNDTLVDIDDTNTRSPSYSYTKVKKIIEDWIKLMDDRYWGADEDGFFYVKQLSQTIDHYIYSSDRCPYEKLDYSLQAKQIKATRLQVWQKVAGSGETQRIGEVGYGGSYPVLAIENVVGKIEDRITAPENLSYADALEWAYAQINISIPVNIKIVNLDRDVHDVSIGDLIKVWDTEDEIYNPIIDCDSLTPSDGVWSGGASLDTSDFTDGIGSIAFSVLSIFTWATGARKWRQILKFGFMFKSDIIGTIAEFSLDGGTTWYDIYVIATDSWEFKSYEITDDDFTEFRVRPKTGSPNMNIDNIGLYQVTRLSYEANAIKIDQPLKDSRYNIELGVYDLKANDRLFYLENKVRMIDEALSQ